MLEAPHATLSLPFQSLLGWISRLPFYFWPEGAVVPFHAPIFSRIAACGGGILGYRDQLGAVGCASTRSPEARLCVRRGFREWPRGSSRAHWITSLSDGGPLCPAGEEREGNRRPTRY
ncbi:hypothetical protein E2C01_041055 [Portunus trituberculatus]|uniref:Uncharacterized protein n=1 Tax=Portunus trituberculatus TaxID=210409 RepID=A0A5B7FQF4_PORTR|nr:hypothetical protein [Portunus trituberculatus]